MVLIPKKAVGFHPEETASAGKVSPLILPAFLPLVGNPLASELACADKKLVFFGQNQSPYPGGYRPQNFDLFLEIYLQISQKHPAWDVLQRFLICPAGYLIDLLDPGDFLSHS